MAIIKPTKPDSELPKTWGGTQYPYTEEQIAEGLPEAIPTIIDGGTLNYEKKGVFERMEYVTQVSDAVAGAPIKKTLITNANNQFEYAGIGVYSYSATQTYALDDYVIYSTNEGTKIYKSLSNNNIGKELTNETYWEELSLGGGGSGLEIGDIGIAPLGIDETQNKRRYLNGQVISQVQFVSFTNKIKEAVALYPNIATTEGNWQAEVTNSKLGQCGKFVIDDNAGTIRLPKVVNIQGLQDLSLLGGIKAESLPNIKGLRKSDTVQGEVSGAYSKSNALSSYGTTTGSLGYFNVEFDASLYSDTYQDNAPVQQEAIQYPYFIQVATGSEESVDVTREIELNNPFFFGMSHYFESEPNNASWLISNGNYHSGTVYKSFYQWLLKIYNGTLTVDGVSVKAYGASDITDYDYVINTSDTTFRLPVSNGTESIVSSRIDELTLKPTTDYYKAPANGYIQIRLDAENAYGQVLIYDENDTNQTTPIFNSGIPKTGINTPRGMFYIHKGQYFIYNSSVQGTIKFIYVLGNGNLYFYVGETIQDANVINAAGVLTSVSNKANVSLDNLSAAGEEVIDNRITNIVNSKKYDIFPRTATDISGSRANWTAPSNGWLRFTYTHGNMATGEIYINGIAMVHTDWQNNWNSGNAYLTWLMKKGDRLTSSIPGYYTFWTTA